MDWAGSPGDPQGSLYSNRTRRGFGGTWPIRLPYREGKRGCDLPVDIQPVTGCFGTPIQAPCALCFSRHSPSPNWAVLPHLSVCPAASRAWPGSWSLSLSACLCRVFGKPQLGLFISLRRVWRESVSRLEGGQGWGLFRWPVATGVNQGAGWFQQSHRLARRELGDTFEKGHPA